MSIVICRICLQKGLETINIFVDTLISIQIMSLTNIQVSPNDGRPNTICVKCLEKLKDCIEFIELCKKSDLYLRHSLIDTKECDKETIDDGGSDDERSQEVPSDQVRDTLKNNICITSKANDVCKKHKDTVNDNKKTGKPQCFICGKVMSSRFRLKTHLVTHSQEKPFSCHYCEKNFTTQQNLRVHLRTHMGQKPHQCSICGKKFTQSSGLSVHKRKHSGLLPYKCKLCPRNFRTIGHLQYHIRGHTGEKSYVCSTCDHSFITNSDLKSHILTHTGEKPHICSVCGMQFSRASNLRRHVHNSHKKEDYSCTKCEKKFLIKNNFEKHKCNNTEIKLK